MSEDERKRILTMLGLDRAKIGFRNRYVGQQSPLLESMRGQGWLVRDPFGDSEVTPWIYRVTRRGLAAAGLKPEQLDSEEREDMPE